MHTYNLIDHHKLTVVSMCPNQARHGDRLLRGLALLWTVELFFCLGCALSPPESSVVGADVFSPLCVTVSEFPPATVIACRKSDCAAVTKALPFFFAFILVVVVVIVRG